MIKINLSVAQNQVDISNLGGFDFSKIKLIPVALSIIAIYIPDLVFVDIWDQTFNARTDELSVVQRELNSLKRKVSQSAVLEKQIRELKAQEDNLSKKLTAVKQAISQKRNPANLLLYIAKNIPEDLWIQEISIEGETMLVKGQALSYVSVGNFVNNLRSSVFIKDSNIKSTTSSVREIDKRRIESFEIAFSIARLD